MIIYIISYGISIVYHISSKPDIETNLKRNDRNRVLGCILLSLHRILSNPSHVRSSSRVARRFRALAARTPTPWTRIMGLMRLPNEKVSATSAGMNPFKERGKSCEIPGGTSR